MRTRDVRTLALFLALGLVAHVVIAIGCAVAAQRPFGLDKRHRQQIIGRAIDDRDNFNHAAMLRGGPEPTQADKAAYPSVSWTARSQRFILERFGYREYGTSEPFIDAPADVKWYDIRPLCRRKFRIEAGWPARSAWVDLEYLVDLNAEQRELQGGLFPRTAYVQALPIAPIPGGFVLNTLFYSAVFFALFAAVVGPGRLRRRLRLQRGLCQACAYPVGRSSVCTECGTPVAKPPGTRQQNAIVTCE